jgi:hypothetical protein
MLAIAVAAADICQLFAASVSQLFVTTAAAVASRGSTADAAAAIAAAASAAAAQRSAPILSVTGLTNPKDVKKRNERQFFI